MRNKLVLLLVDESDQMYRVKSHDLTRRGHYDLEDLNWLGDQKSGCVAVQYALCLYDLCDLDQLTFVRIKSPFPRRFIL